MAEEGKGGGGPMEMVWLLGVFMVALIALWFLSGAYKEADLRGIFLAPPAPLGPGDAYGPQFGTTSDYYYDN